MKYQYRAKSTKGKFQKFQEFFTTALQTQTAQPIRNLQVQPKKNELKESPRPSPIQVQTRPSVQQFQLPFSPTSSICSPCFDSNKRAQMTRHSRLSTQFQDCSKVQSPLTYSMNKALQNLKFPLISPSLHQQASQKLENRQLQIIRQRHETRPCARDGHIAIYYQQRNKMIIFGGDRYRYSLGDLFMLDLGKVGIESIQIL